MIEPGVHPGSSWNRHRTWRTSVSSARRC